ncbi:PSP1 domain-containing protein [Treponema pedis]|uniref:PSP1 domain-containing protein n=1 Tax=Treponema pedis TaxID=409322 RepID=UPI000426D7CA|nr:regulatory iron-sulfur-containing complex subunit RicT [Treponema pedis]
MTYNEDENIEDIAALEDSDVPPLRKAAHPEDFPSPLYQLKLEYSQETVYAVLPAGLVVKPGEYVLTPTRYGNDIAKFCGQVKCPINSSPDEVVTVIRKTTAEDLFLLEENKNKEKEAGVVFKEKVALNNLDMKFIGCHFLFDESKVLFFFSADNRIDFRKLVKDLVSVFKVRVELRQIGVRDESRIIGGLGCCGRPYCCHGVTDKLNPVSIKMAKEQNLSLNSTKISGQCGRLLCCLAYEHEWYSDVRKAMPPEGIKFGYDGTIFKITELNPITQMVSLLGEDGRILSIPSKRIKNVGGKWQIR